MTRPADDARLDELLRYEEAVPADRRNQAVWLWLARTALSAAALAALTVLLARMLGIGLPYPVVFAGTVAILLLRRVVGEVPVGPPPGTRTRVLSENVDAPRDGMAAAAARWNTRLNWTHSDPEAFSRNVRPAIAELADERLRQRHGITRATDPDRARALLGDPLWTFLAAPVKRTPTPQQLAALIAGLEAL